MVGDALPPMPADIMGAPPLTDDDILAYAAAMESLEPIADRDVPAISELREQVEQMPAGRWRIEDEAAAEWAMRKYAAAQARRREVELLKANWVEQVEQWARRELAGVERDESFFGGHLERYAVARREATGGTVKTVLLPSGSVPTTGHKPKAVVEDEEAVVRWARRVKRPEVVKTTETVLVGELRKAVELVPVPDTLVLTCGCVLEARSDGRPAGWTAAHVLDSLVPGTGMTCPECGADALVGQWTAEHLEVFGFDGHRVPGVAVEPAGVTAKVRPR